MKSVQQLFRTAAPRDPLSFRRKQWLVPLLSLLPALSLSFGVPLSVRAALPDFEGHAFFGSDGNDQGRAVATDAAGNTYIVGGAAKTWGNSPVSPYQGGVDIFVVKISPQGDLLWNGFYGSASDDIGHDLTVDDQGNIYVAASSKATWGTAPLHPHAGSGFTDCTIFKLDASGKLLWNTFYGSSDDDDANGIALDGLGNVVITGDSFSKWQAGNDDIAPLGPDPATNTDLLTVIKLDRDGNYNWHVFYGSDAQDSAAGVQIDNQGNIYLTGESEATWTGAGGEAPLHTHSGGDDDLTALSLNSGGAYRWHTFYGSTQGYTVGYDLALDGSGSLVLVGASNDTWLGDNDIPPLHDWAVDYDIVAIRLDTDGKYRWHTFYGSSVGESGNSVVFDLDGDVYIGGSSEASWNGDGNTEPEYPYQGGADFTLLHLTSAGSYVGHGFFGSATNDRGGELAGGSEGQLLMTGFSTSSWNGPGNQTPFLSYSGGEDIAAIIFRPASFSWPMFLPAVTGHRR